MAITNFSAVSAALGPSLRRTDQNRYVYVKFQGGIAGDHQEVDGTAAVVTDAGVNKFSADGEQFFYVVEQAYAGAVPQITDAAGGGAKILIDAADNDGLFLTLPHCTGAGQGTLRTAGKGLFTGRTDGFFVRVKLNITTKANADEVALSVRKIQLLNTSTVTVTDNTDFAALNVDNGTIKIMTNLNDGGVSTTSTTMTTTDGTDVTLEIRVSESGFVRFFVNGAAPTVDVTNFQFDADTLHFALGVVVDATGADPGVIVKEWESGLLTERGLDGINDLVN